MINRSVFTARYTCGLHVTGSGRQISDREGHPVPADSERQVEHGVITMMPGRRGDPYTVLYHVTIIVLESQEEQIRSIS